MHTGKALVRLTLDAAVFSFSGALSVFTEGRGATSSSPSPREMGRRINNYRALHDIEKAWEVRSTTAKDPEAPMTGYA
jgi:hypothetical protein